MQSTLSNALLKFKEKIVHQIITLIVLFLFKAIIRRGILQRYTSFFDQSMFSNVINFYKSIMRFQ